ncbi:MAG TPA: DUF367 domain-containing protein [Thermoplasmata archaeon]|nr:DUF367 domain-containing protein [Thermoplasmata archaeon]
MRSFGSTPSPPPSGAVPLFLVLVGDDHPRACTGRRLVRHGLVREFRARERGGPAPVLLDPYAPRPLSPADAPRAERAGIVAVDCSWNRLADRGRLLPPAAPGSSPLARRRLPLLIATNPQHYGRLAELNTVEALAAALALTGRPREAERLLAGFRGSEQFLVVNAERLSAYRAATSAEEVRAAERRLFGGAPA